MGVFGFIDRVWQFLACVHSHSKLVRFIFLARRFRWYFPGSPSGVLALKQGGVSSARQSGINN